MFRKLESNAVFNDFSLKSLKVAKVLQKAHGLHVTHGSMIARTVMCRQDGGGRFPVLLDNLSKCRTNHKENPNLVRILYDIYIRDGVIAICN